MKAARIGGLSVLVVIVGLAGWYWQSISAGVDKGPSPLVQEINQCDLIASKAAAGLPEALPFQKLEKAARQSRVLERCMQDRGYQENKAWVDQARQQASKVATEQQVSQSEAYETLRRKAMLQGGQDVSYWQKKRP